MTPLKLQRLRGFHLREGDHNIWPLAPLWILLTLSFISVFVSGITDHQIEERRKKKEEEEEAESIDQRKKKKKKQNQSIRRRI